MLAQKDDNLGARQRKLNEKVNEALKQNVIFDDMKNTNEKSDVDKLFKIDLADKYKNAVYIVEILKSGDSLYISRALKCLWLYDDENKCIINTDFIDQEIFPQMSQKMKKKMLTAIAIHIKDTNRAENFYEYCKENNQNNIAQKFLMKTSEDFKANITKAGDLDNLPQYINAFVLDSFPLAKLLLNNDGVNKVLCLDALKYLYNVSNTKYLDLLEMYADSFKNDAYIKYKFGLRFSKHIINKHKDRIHKNPLLYYVLLNKTILIKQCSVEEAKLFAKCLLPDLPKQFWNNNYPVTYKTLLNIISHEERFNFVKKIFTEKYPEENFDTNPKFYLMGHYYLMTDNEKEEWALKNVAGNAEILGSGNNFLWYEFVNFETAFDELKKQIYLASSKEKRAVICEVMAKAAKNSSDILKLLQYYYKRHVKESELDKCAFLHVVAKYQNVYDFDEATWSAFEIILQSMDIYAACPRTFVLVEFRKTVFFYLILHDKPIPDVLKVHYQLNRFFRYKDLNNDCCSMNEKQKAKLCQFLIDFYSDAVKQFINTSYDERVKMSLRLPLDAICDILRYFDKSKDVCPETVINFMNKDEKYNTVVNEENPVITEGQLLRLLKKDVTALDKKLPEVKRAFIDSDTYRINLFLSKLKIYFQEDVAKKWIQYFMDVLTQKDIEYQLLNSATALIFRIGDDAEKSSFMAKHVPVEDDIDFRNINRTLLKIQEAICRFSFYSRPPVPLSHTMKYLRGQYISFCLPMFNNYLANLPNKICLEFVEGLLDKPVSTQKHGIRLAFKCFSTENLIKVVKKSWKKTNNVFLRKVLYTYVYKKVTESNNKKEQCDILELLKEMTIDINENDDETVFDCFRLENLQQEFRADYLESVWKCVDTLSDKQVNLQRKQIAISRIESNLDVMSEDCLKNIVNKHIHSALNENIAALSEEEKLLIDMKWSITAGYIVLVNKENQDDKMQTLLLLINTCFDRWNEVVKDVFVIQKFFSEFLEKLVTKSVLTPYQDYQPVCSLLKRLLSELKDTFPLYKIYLYVWRLRLAIVRIGVIDFGGLKYKRTDYYFTADNPKRVTMNSIALQFGKDVTDVIEEFVKTNCYYSLLASDIQLMITDEIRNLNSYFCNEVFDEICVLVAKGLISEKKIEQSVLLAAKIIPDEGPPDAKEDFSDVLQEIRKFDSDEVKAVMHLNFVNEKFKRKKYV